MAYRSFPYQFASHGLVAKFAPDNAPPASFLNLDGLESRIEGALSTRMGLLPLNVDNVAKLNLTCPDANIHTLGRLRGTALAWRYLGAGTNLYRLGADNTPTKIAQNLSGNPFSLVVYRTDFASEPWIYIADGTQMLADNGSLTSAVRWGMFPPTAPPVYSLQGTAFSGIDLFEVDPGWTFNNVAGAAVAARVNTATASGVTANADQWIAVGDITNIIRGMVVTLDAAGAAEAVIVEEVQGAAFRAFCVFNHALGVTVTANNVAGTLGVSPGEISRLLALDLSGSGGDDTFTFWVKLDKPYNDTGGIGLFFDVNDGSFAHDYYYAQNATIGQTQADIPVGLYLNRSGTQTYSFVVIANFSDGTHTGNSLPSTIVNAVYITVLWSGVPGAISYDVYCTSSTNPVTAPGTGVVSVGKIATVTGDGPFAIYMDRDHQYSADGAAPPTTTASFITADQWTPLTFKRSSFSAVGMAGSPGFTWADVVGWKLQFQTNGAAIVLGVDDLYLSLVAPTSQGGVGYDYRLTEYDQRTGTESNATVASIYSLLPSNQPLLVDWSATPLRNARATHYRLYRRGGGYADNWRRVAQLPVGTTSYSDSTSDALIAGAEVLEIDNDPPVTVTLPRPVDTTLGGALAPGLRTVTPPSMVNIFADQYLTIDDGEDRETVIVRSITATKFVAYFQGKHGASARVYAETRPGMAVNLATSAFERMWLAGDPYNPNRLYYSKTSRPESFSPAAYVEVGSPKDVIRGLLEHRGMLYVPAPGVFHQILSTQGTQYQLLGYGGTSAPIPSSTAASRGLAASWGWTKIPGALRFIAFDGICNFAGGAEEYMSELTDWLWKGKAYGPLTPIDVTKIDQTKMAFHQNETYISYVGKDAVRRRLIYHETWKRWRNDSIPASAMLYEEDTGNLLLAKGDGMVYVDRQLDYDSGGWAGGVAVQNPIAFSLLTAALDQGEAKREKVYNELTLDANTRGQTVNVALVFDNLGTEVAIGTLNTAARQQVQFNINAGRGQRSRNVALKLTGTAVQQVDFYKVHIRAEVEAEWRKSFDSYWTNLGVEGYSVVKQMWIEYASPNSAVTVQISVDGSEDVVHSFTLPQAATKTLRRVRFPAIKARLWRFVGTSSTDFQVYPEASKIEVKPVCGPKGSFPLPVAS